MYHTLLLTVLLFVQVLVQIPVPVEYKYSYKVYKYKYQNVPTEAELPGRNLTTGTGSSNHTLCARQVYDMLVPEGQLCYRTSAVKSTGTKAVTKYDLYKTVCEEMKASVQLLLCGDSTLRNKYEYFKSHQKSTVLNNHCTKLCRVTACYLPRSVTHKVGELSSGISYLFKAASDPLVTPDFTIAVINVGLHHLHLFPVRNIFSSTVEDLEENLRRDLRLCHRFLSKFAQNPFIFYKMTNAICHENFVNPYAEAITRWAEPASNHTDCYAHARRVLNATEDKAADTCERLPFNNNGVNNVNLIASNAIRTLNRTLMLDDYTLTRDRCACSGVGDGRHYGPLVPLWWQLSLKIVNMCVLNTLKIR